MAAIPVREQRIPSLSYSSDEGDSWYDPSPLSTSVVCERRDSLPTHFDDGTIKAFSSALPENYTIDHSTLRKQQEQERPDGLSSVSAAEATEGRLLQPMPIPAIPRLQRQYRKFQYTCEVCGKVYKHSSYLTKHRWEHSAQWKLTSKFLLTKHQQVQMLEAAAILVSMDRDTQQQVDDDQEDDDEEAFWIDI